MAARYTPPRSLGQHRASLRDAAAGDHETNIPRSVPQSLTDMPSRMPAGGKDMMSSDNNTTSHNSHHPKPLPTPNKSASPLPSNLLPSAPASPPTPAPSPTPHHTVSNWQSSLGGGGGGGHEADDEDEDDSLLLKAQIYFSSMGSAQKQKFLVDILNLCDNQQLSFVSSFISPRLRKDPFLSFPNEICLRVSTEQLWTCILLHTHVGWYRYSRLSTIQRRLHEPRKYRNDGTNLSTTILPGSTYVINMLTFIEGRPTTIATLSTHSTAADDCPL
jgi:hypothetical protein